MTTETTESMCPECSNGTCLVCQEHHYEARKVVAGPSPYKPGQVVRWRHKRIDGLGRFRVNAIYFSRATHYGWMVDLTVLRAEGQHHRGKMTHVEVVDLARVTRRRQPQRRRGASEMPLP